MEEKLKNSKNQRPEWAKTYAAIITQGSHLNEDRMEQSNTARSEMLILINVWKPTPLSI